MTRILFLEKEREEKVVELYKQVVANGGDFDKLTIVKLDYGYRVRYEKDSEGNIIAKVMDRGFIGLTESKIGLSDSNDIATCFIYGKRTVGAVIKGDALLLNNNLKESADFNVLMLNLANEKNLYIEWIEGLQTGEVKHNKVEKTLSDCIATAKTLETLGSDLGF